MAEEVATSGKSKVVFALLAWFLGTFGAQYFYVGKTKAGIIFLCVSWLTCGIGATITGLISVVQCVMALIGTDEKFEATYVNTEKSFPLF